jgi:hypothetical protein
MNARNEVVVQPLKSSLTPQELKLLRDMLDRIMPVDVIVTINLQGLAVLHPVPITSAASNSTYFQIRKTVIATPVLSQLPPPELLPIDLLPTETWLYDAMTDPTLAPYAHLNISAQVGYYYTLGGGSASPIDSVVYGTLNEDGSITQEQNFVAYQSTAQFTPWASWAVADSPDNYPGGKFGIHPSYAPAVNSDQTPYNFPWDSQDAYVTAQIAIVQGMGGNATETQYQLPIQAPNQTQLAFLPEYAVAYSAPGQDSTISASLTRNRPVQVSGTQGWTSTTGFVRA